jgi:uncharacterized protein (TIGR03437 family)
MRSALAVKSLTAAVLSGAAAIVFGQSLQMPPEYSEASIVNAASGTVGRLAPNTIVTIHGRNLSRNTWAMRPEDLLGPVLPVTTPDQAVHVQVNNVRVPLYFVSPNQINFWMPASLAEGPATVRVYRELLVGPAARLTLLAESPELFRSIEGMVAGTLADGSALSEARPARAGDTVVLYGTGFGRVEYSDAGAANSAVPRAPAQLVRREEFRVRIDGEELGREAIYYVGVTPGYLGLFQVNVRLPQPAKSRPTVEAGFAGNWSGGAVWLPMEFTATLPLSPAFHH